MTELQKLLDRDRLQQEHKTSRKNDVIGDIVDLREREKSLKRDNAQLSAGVRVFVCVFVCVSVCIAIAQYVLMRILLLTSSISRMHALQSCSG